MRTGRIGFPVYIPALLGSKAASGNPIRKEVFTRFHVRSLRVVENQCRGLARNLRLDRVGACASCHSGARMGSTDIGWNPFISAINRRGEACVV